MKDDDYNELTVGDITAKAVTLLALSIPPVRRQNLDLTYVTEEPSTIVSGNNIKNWIYWNDTEQMYQLHLHNYKSSFFFFLNINKRDFCSPY